MRSSGFPPHRSISWSPIRSCSTSLPRSSIGCWRSGAGCWRRAAALIVADVIPPGVGVLTDTIALLRYAARNGFLLAAIVGLGRTIFSRYRRLRAKLGISCYGESGIPGQARGRRLRRRAAALQSGAQSGPHDVSRHQEVAPDGGADRRLARRSGPRRPSIFRRGRPSLAAHSGLKSGRAGLGPQRQPRDARQRAPFCAPGRCRHSGALSSSERSS